MARSTRPSLVTASIYGLGLVGLLGTWGRTVLDGTLMHLLGALHGADDYLLPAAQGGATLRKTFTGLRWPIDYLLDVLVVFFWEAVDGSHPATSASGVYFLSQLFPIVVIFYLSALRGTKQGLARQVFQASMWLLLFQGCALGATAFIWALAFSRSSPTVNVDLPLESLRRASQISPSAALVLLLVALLAYGGTALAMALPPGGGLVTYETQQLAIAGWNMYPLVLSVCFAAIHAMLSPLCAPQPRTDKAGAAAQKHAHLGAVRLVGGVTLLLSSVLHVAVLSVSFATVLFPALFDAEFAAELSPGMIFLPPVAITQSFTVGDGVRSFFLWDQVAGYPTIMLVLLLELRAAMAVSKRSCSFSWVNGIVGATAASLLFGPGSACVVMSWLRDEMLFAD